MKRRIKHSDKENTAVVTGIPVNPHIRIRFAPVESYLNQTVTDYCGNVIYENGKLKYILTPEGYITNNENTAVYNYYLKDHLGNNRVVLEVNGGNAAVIQKTDYYPFGMPYADNESPEKQPYKFGGKEYDETYGLNWYDFGARQLDATIPRLTTMDPLAEKYYSVSPYAYCANNPIRYVDYRGDSISLAGMQQLDQALGTNYVGQITSDLQSQTGLTITVGADGKMSYAKDKKGNPIIATTKDANGKTVQAGSATARTLMTGAIDHQDMVTVAPGKSGVLPGTNDIGLNFKQIDGFINGTVGMDNSTLGWGMTLMHELHHTQVGGGLRDTPGNPGPVVTQMNIIRSELGGNYGQRLDYYGTPIGGNVFLPFNRSAKESIILGLHPSIVRPGQQYIKY